MIFTAVGDARLSNKEWPSPLQNFTLKSVASVPASLERGQDAQSNIDYKHRNALLKHWNHLSGTKEITKKTNDDFISLNNEFKPVFEEENSQRKIVNVSPKKSKFAKIHSQKDLAKLFSSTKSIMKESEDLRTIKSGSSMLKSVYMVSCIFFIFHTIILSRTQLQTSILLISPKTHLKTQNLEDYTKIPRKH